MKDPRTNPVIRVEFRFADGSLIEKDWTMENCPPKTFLVPVPGWIEEGTARKFWYHPQDPITFRGDVKAGREDEARQYVESF